MVVERARVCPHKIALFLLARFAKVLRTIAHGPLRIGIDWILIRFVVAHLCAILRRQLRGIPTGPVDLIASTRTC